MKTTDELAMKHAALRDRGAAIDRILAAWLVDVERIRRAIKFVEDETRIDPDVWNRPTTI